MCNWLLFDRPLTRLVLAFLASTHTNAGPRSPSSNEWRRRILEPARLAYDVQRDETLQVVQRGRVNVAGLAGLMKAAALAITSNASLAGGMPSFGDHGGSKSEIMPSEALVEIISSACHDLDLPRRLDWTRTLSPTAGHNSHVFELRQYAILKRAQLLRQSTS